MTFNGELPAGGACVFCGDIGRLPKESIPSGAMVRVTWSGSPGGMVSFEVANSTFWPVCYSSAPQGACTFMSSGGNYTFLMNPTGPRTEPYYVVNFTAQWYVPLL